MAAYDYASGGFPTSPVTNDTLAINGTSYIYNGSAWEVVGGIGEGTAILSTGETGGTKYLREDGDGTCSWQTVAGGGGGIGSFIDTSIAISSDGTALANDDGTDNNNIAIGAYALTTAVAGFNNIGIGKFSLYNNNGGDYNTAVGYGAGQYITTGNNNTSTGFYAGKNISTGASNTAVGHESLFGNATSKLTGSYNTGIGYQTGYNLTTGHNNILNGYQAGFNITDGEYNICSGHDSGKMLGSGSIGNTIIGGLAGSGSPISNTTYNTFIGYKAGQVTTVDNCIALGANAAVSSNGEMQLGSSIWITAAYTAVAFATRSDERQKDIEDMDLGLDFVTKVTPIKYKWKADAEASDKDSYFYGFSAQDVKANLPTDDAYSMHRTQGDEDGVQNLTYTEMIAPLYKAIQEQQEMIKSMQLEINTLKGVK